MKRKVFDRINSVPTKSVLTNSVPTILAALLIGFAIAGSALAQSASESMKEAGHSLGNAASHVYHGTVTAVDDTTLTAKVKTALHNDKLTKGTDIHVTTVAGVVTLKGAVPSSEVSSHAQQVAQDTTGVKGVKNELSHP